LNYFQHKPDNILIVSKETKASGSEFNATGESNPVIPRVIIRYAFGNRIKKHVHLSFSLRRELATDLDWPMLKRPEILKGLAAGLLSYFGKAILQAT